MTTVEQKPSGTAVNPEKKPPAAPDNDISQEDLDKLVELGQAASKDAMKNTPKAKEGA